MTGTMTNHRREEPPGRHLQIIPEDEVDGADLETDGGVLFLRQKFEVPEGTMPVRMQVGGLPVTIIGWTDGSPGALPGLLRDVANEVEKIEKARDESGS